MPITRACIFAGLDRTLLTLWVGGLWISGYLVAPILFSMLEDRQLAGQLAGQVFQVMNYIGMAVAGYLIISTAVRTGNQGFMKEWRFWVLVVMLSIILVAAFVIQPMMQELKIQGIGEGSIQAKEFGRLHGLSSILFLINSILGLLLVAIGIHRKPIHNKP